jgi:hypothetical protein
MQPNNVDPELVWQQEALFDYYDQKPAAKPQSSGGQEVIDMLCDDGNDDNDDDEVILGKSLVL